MKSRVDHFDFWEAYVQVHSEEENILLLFSVGNVDGELTSDLYINTYVIYIYIHMLGKICA